MVSSDNRQYLMHQFWTHKSASSLSGLCQAKTQQLQGQVCVYSETWDRHKLEYITAQQSYYFEG